MLKFAVTGHGFTFHYAHSITHIVLTYSRLNTEQQVTNSDIVPGQSRLTSTSSKYSCFFQMANKLANRLEQSMLRLPFPINTRGENGTRKQTT